MITGSWDSPDFIGSGHCRINLQQIVEHNNQVVQGMALV